MALLDALGFSADTRAIIMSCDDLGTSHAANAGIEASIREGTATSASLVVPAPWARDAALRLAGTDIGIRLTLTTEFEHLIWGPITHAPSLLGGEGGFPRSVTDVWEHADLDELRRECRAQIERAITWDLGITHLDSYRGVLGLRPEFFDVALDLAVEFNLPLRLGDESVERAAGFPFRQLADEAGVLSPDNVIVIDDDTTVEGLLARLHAVEAGVTELIFKPALDTPELRAITPQWQSQVAHASLLTSEAVKSVLKAKPFTLIDYGVIRGAQHAH